MKKLKLYEDFDEWNEDDFDYEESEKNKKPFRLKKGITVQIKSEDEIRKYNFHPNSMAYNLQLAGKIVDIKRAFRNPMNRGFGPIDSFEVEGYRHYILGQGFDDIIIDKEI